MIVKLLADSINARGARLTTFLLEDFPKCLLAELNTHRVFSRNAASSRAIPTTKLIETLREKPFIPHWTGNRPGMVGTELTEEQRKQATDKWMGALERQIAQVEQLLAMGIHKQNVNRLLEPWMTVPVIVSATEWENFFKLRCSPEAQPEFREFACEMRRLYLESQPRELFLGEWHIPVEDGGFSLQQTHLKVATAKCAAVSYRNHDKDRPIAKDIELHDRLLKSGHMSPFEHCAINMGTDTFFANFRGWRQYRSLVENV